MATIGANAPFVGLLGTVFGIMRSFHDLDTVIQDAGQQTVMADISSIVLLATAMGLAVTIPSIIPYNYFRRRVNGRGIWKKNSPLNVLYFITTFAGG